MKYQSTKRNVILGLLTLFLIASFPGISRADNVVLAGYDLFATQPRTQVNLGPAGIQPLVGVPLGSFDFGMGPVATFNADTIVQRLGNATVGNPTVPIQLIALQLMSVNQFNLGAGTGFHFVTLQSARGGPASMGTITINGLGTEPAPGQQHGTFNSVINVMFDIRFGSLDGPIVFSGDKTLTAYGIPWSHFPPPDAVLISGVNFLLNGQDQSNDFFPIGLFTERNPDGSKHTVQTATVPEPTTVVLLTAGLAGVAAKLRKRSQASGTSDT